MITHKSCKIIAQSNQLDNCSFNIICLHGIRAIIKDIIEPIKLHTKLCFDKIAIWEHFLAFDKRYPDTNKIAQFNKFDCDDEEILDISKGREKISGICSGHVIYLQRELSKRGINSYVVAQFVPGKGFVHAALAVRSFDDDKNEWLSLVEPFQNPDYIELKVADKTPISYGVPYKSSSNILVKRFAFVQDNRVIIQDIDPKTGVLFDSFFTTDRSVNISKLVSKPHLLYYPKIPWVAHDVKKRGCPKAAIVMINLADRKILLRDIINKKDCVIELSDIHAVLKPLPVKSELNHFISDTYISLFGVSSHFFWNRLAHVLGDHSCFCFDHLHLNQKYLTFDY